jgi:hypothetical protein
MLARHVKLTITRGGGDYKNYYKQGCGSGSGLDPYSIGSVDPDPDPGGQKWPTKVDKNL